MIEHLHVKNYKCLRDVTVKLAPLTILVGPNDSGKSSLLQALALLRESAEQYVSSVSPCVFGGARAWPNSAWLGTAEPMLFEFSGSMPHRFSYFTRGAARGL